LISAASLKQGGFLKKTIEGVNYKKH